MKFVWLDVRGGGQVPVNPDQVAYLRKPSAEHDQGHTEVVFGAVQGGLHSLVVTGDGREVARQLEGAAESGMSASDHFIAAGKVKEKRPPVKAAARSKTGKAP